MPEDVEIIQFYNEFAGKYDATVLAEEDYTAFKIIPEWLLKKIPGKAKILDLGCGTGLGSQKFIENGHAVTGIDISPQMVVEAKKLGYKKLICQSLREPLPFKDDVFDAVILLGVMEFIEKPEALFDEVARVLKPNGLFGLTVPKKQPDEVEKEVGILTHELDQMERCMMGFSLLKMEDFQGFQCRNQTIFYRGYLLKRN